MKLIVSLALLIGLVIGLAASGWVPSQSNQKKESISVKASNSRVVSEPRLSHGDHFAIVR